MAHPQPRMAAFLDVMLGPAKAADQELPQPLLCPVHVVGRVHGPEDVVGRHLVVKRRNEAREARLTDLRVDISFRNHQESII
jgi:hypothetical protein